MKQQTTNINSILIANRGEIASRIIRTCKKMGIKSIAVFSEADRNALYVSEATTAIYIGESNPSQSYLDINKIILAAQKTGANAIHPGYGFLSENVAFAKKCMEEGLIFIGPNVRAISEMGSKSNAKALMEAHKVPTVPGYRGEDQSETRLKSEAEKIGFPVLLKATAGGGGKGMRIVRNTDEVKNAIAAAKREALSAFGDDEMMVEKYIEAGRHIEFQIFGDQHGNAIHLLERECSIQRRYQKVIEESPSPVMTDELRERMGKAAVDAAKALNYDNAGTVEFIFDDKTNDFYFLEVNTRLQVEHPVTEEITGLDLVQMQIESAQGKPLAIRQEAVKGQGYAIEVRLYAEDANNNFLPVTGKVIDFQVPEVEGLRVETAIQNGSEISVYYDPMIAKLIVWDNTRADALRKMTYVLQHLICTGTTTNQAFLLQITQNADFIQGKYDTHFIEKQFDFSKNNTKGSEAIHASAIAATLLQWQERQQKRKLLSAIPSGWRSNFYDFQKDTYQCQEEEITVQYRYLKGHFNIRIEQTDYEVRLIKTEQSKLQIEINGIRSAFHISKKGNHFYTQQEAFGNVELILKDRFPEKEKEVVKGGYIAPMPSQIVKILVIQGDDVKAGDALIVLSSMKMENTIYADEGGKVEEIYVEENTNVEADVLLLKIT